MMNYRLLVPVGCIALCADDSAHADATTPCHAHAESDRSKFDALLAADHAQRQHACGGPILAGCPLFPADNIWNARIDALPVHPQSNTYITFIGASTGLHPDFGSGTWDGGPIGIPFNIVPSTQANVPISFYYPDESDPGPYPIPPGALIEWGSDHHILILQQGTCLLYEVYDASTEQRRRVVERGLRREMELEFERAANSGLDLGGRGGSGDAPRLGALRRSRGRRNQTRDSFHCPRDKRHIHLARTTPDFIPVQCQRAADGATLSLEIVFQYLHLLAASTSHFDGVQTLWYHRGGQRQ